MTVAVAEVAVVEVAEVAIKLKTWLVAVVVPLLGRREAVDSE
jgi:hypothetical protein